MANTRGTRPRTPTTSFKQRSPRPAGRIRSGSRGWRCGESAEDPIQEQPERRPLLAGEILQHLVFEALPRLVRALQGAPPGRGDLDDVAPAVARVAAPDRELAGLELVQDQDHAVRV